MNTDKTIKSFINLTEEIENKDAYRTANKKYFPAYIITKDEDNYPVLFTIKEIEKAYLRAKKNPEDIYPIYEETEEINGFLPDAMYSIPDDNKKVEKTEFDIIEWFRNLIKFN